MNSSDDARGTGARYQSVQGLTRVLLAMLAVAVAVDAAAVVSSGMGLEVLRGNQIAPDMVASLVFRENSLGAFALVLMVATLPVFAVWIVRAHLNLPSLGARNLDVTPAGALGWFIQTVSALLDGLAAMLVLRISRAQSAQFRSSKPVRSREAGRPA